MRQVSEKRASRRLEYGVAGQRPVMPRILQLHEVFGLKACLVDIICMRILGFGGRDWIVAAF
jgi:hypothetical protein